MTIALEHEMTEQLLSLYRSMLLIRRFEERAAEYLLAGEMPGFLHLSVGQEATCVGVCSVLQPEDAITSTHRAHGHILARGADPGRTYAELFAKEEGYNRARGGSLHVIDSELGFLGANGIVGGGIPIAAGAALQLKRSGKAAAAVAFFGEGAANEGAFHEVLNLAALWKLPAVFVCENNLYGEFTPQSAQSPIADVAERAAAYGIPGVIADGNDVLDVRSKAEEALTRARTGGGPTLLECKTYRHRGHFEGDTMAYRPEGEYESWLERDPIATFKARLSAEMDIREDEFQAVADSVEQQLDDAVAFARQGTSPTVGQALEYVYVDSIEGKALR